MTREESTDERLRRASPYRLFPSDLSTLSSQPSALSFPSPLPSLNFTDCSPRAPGFVRLLPLLCNRRTT